MKRKTFWYPVVVILTLVVAIGCKTAPQPSPPIEPPTLTAEKGGMTIKWLAVDGATSYKVYYSKTPDQSEAVIRNVTFLTTTINDLDNDTGYYVWLRAVYTGGRESELSKPAQTTTLGSESPTPTPSRVGNRYVLYFDAYLNNFTGKNNLIGKNLGTREQYDSLRIILYVAGILNKNPNYRLLVEGFANPTGNDIQAEQDRLVPLSIARANEVADLLTNVLKNAEVDRKRLIVVGEGGLKNSLATNETGQKRNRRAELTIIEPPTPQRSFLLAFESNSTVLTSRNLEALTQDQIKSLQTMVSAVTYLNNNKTHQALIEGYATPEEIAWGGSGKPLSEQRAEEVAAWLIKEKIGPDRITIVRGAGTNTTQERKVEIIMLETNPDVLPEDPLSPNR